MGFGVPPLGFPSQCNLHGTCERFLKEMEQMETGGKANIEWAGEVGVVAKGFGDQQRGKPTRHMPRGGEDEPPDKGSGKNPYRIW